MAFSTQRAVSDGTLILLGVSIGYIKQADIGVFYNGLPAGAGTWSWVGTTTNIAFSPAVPAGVEVLLARTTQIDKIINRFTAGAGFTNQSMDTDFQQVLYLNQEAVEGSALTDVFSDVDFHGFKVRNVGTATDSGDAVSLGQYQADALGASAFKDAAAASASAALTSQNAALVSKNASLVSQNAAAASVVTSGNSASASSISASNSDASRVAAVAAQDAAVIARTGAETALDSFDDRYLGSKSTDPTLDNDGNALLVGALYWNTSIPALRVWNGTAPWITFPSVTAGGISNTPAGTISSTTVQAAINELDSEKAKSGANSDITSISGLTIALPVSQGGTGVTGPGTIGNVLTSNGTIWASTAPVVNGAYRSMQVFTSSGTYTKPTGLVRAKITVIGGGGGGGGGSGVTGGGGGAGGTSIRLIEAGLIGSTVSIAVGSGGSPGNSGNASSMGTLAAATGGSGGGGAASGNTATGGAGGSGSGGSINYGGGAGGPGSSAGNGFGGSGGSSSAGGSGLGGANTGGAGSTGGGGGGTVGAAGGAGGTGIVFIEEYF